MRLRVATSDCKQAKRGGCVKACGLLTSGAARKRCKAPLIHDCNRVLAHHVSLPHGECRGAMPDADLNASLRQISARVACSTQRLICPSGRGSEPVSIPARKKIPIYRNSDLPYVCCIPLRFAEGRFADVTRREAGMRWTRMCRGRTAWRRTAKSRGPGAPKLWRQVQAKLKASRGRRWQTRGFTEESAYKP